MDATYPGIKAEALWLYWRQSYGILSNGKNGKVGHAVLMITHNGYYFLVDAMTGQVYGPFRTTTRLKDIDWVPFLDLDPDSTEDDTLPLRTPSSITPHDPRDRPFTDPKPWHKDPDVRDHLEDSTQRPATDYIFGVA